MTDTMLKYYHVFGDSDDRHEFYYGKEDKLHFETCRVCKKAIDREAAIQAAIAVYKSRFNRLFYETWDGVSIVSERFVGICQKYQMQGLSFQLIPGLRNYYVMRCNNVVRFDTAASAEFEITNICPECGRPDGAYRPYPHRMIAEDEQQLKAMTFYRSDIEFGDRHTQSPLLFATEDIMQAFKTEGGRIFFEIPENGKSVVIDCKGKSE